MRIRKPLLAVVAFGLAVVILPYLPSAGTFPYTEGIELGMQASSVFEALKAKTCEDDLMETKAGFCVALRDNDFFRHACYCFDDRGSLVEIHLTIREVRGTDNVVKELNSAYNLNLSPDKLVVRDGVALGIDGNKLIMRDAEVLPLKAHAKRGPTKEPLAESSK
ncbi:MAG: hypothetical protein HY913_13555 [Desulfomonile tiedjei]|nr:hypothetical protein [Desulfomonile tiedjei]